MLPSRQYLPHRPGPTGHVLRHLFLSTLAEPLGCPASGTDPLPSEGALSYEMTVDDWHCAVFLPARRLVLLEQSIFSTSSSITRHTIAGVVGLDIVTFDLSRPGRPITCEAVLAAPWRSQNETWFARPLWIGEDGTVAAVPDERDHMIGEVTHAFRFDRETIGTPSDAPYTEADDRGDGIARAIAIAAAAPSVSF